MSERVKPRVQLSGTDGNVFGLMGLCVKAGRKAGWTQEDVAAFREAVTSSSSYDEALNVMQEWCDVD